MAQLAKTSTEIDGRRVEVTQLPATVSAIVFVRMVKYFGPSLASLIGMFTRIMAVIPRDTLKGKPTPEERGAAVFAAVMDSNLDMREMSLAIADLTSKLDPTDWQDFCLRALAYTDIDGKRIIDEAAFNVAFNGSIMFMYKVLFYTLGANYPDFLAVSGIGTPDPTPPDPTTAK